MRIRKLEWFFIIGVVLPVAATLGGEGGASYIAARRLATELGLQYEVVATSETDPAGAPQLCRLSRDGHVILIQADLKRAIVNGELLPLSGPVRAEGNDLAVPSDALEKFRALLTRPGSAEGAPAQYPASPPLLRKRKVVLDPGHGGRDPGAIGRGGLQEKEINLAVARSVAGLLAARGVEVVMTRRGDTFIELDERVNIANRERPDAFVSIHTNSSPNDRRLNGFMILYPEDGSAKGTSPETIPGRAAVAAKESSLPPSVIGGVQPLSKAAEMVLYGVLLEEYRIQSRLLGSCIVRGLNARAMTQNLGVREDERGLRVLRWVRAPSVLVEMEFLSNMDAEARLRNPVFREKLAEGIAEGILKFLEMLDRTENFTK